MSARLRLFVVCFRYRSDMKTISRRSSLALIAGAGALFFSLRRGPSRAADASGYALSDEQWRKKLSPEAYDVLRHEGTERPFSSELNHLTKSGTYFCAGCDLALFASKTKFDSGTGWPSFYAPLPHAILTKTDLALGIPRTEVHCARCLGHLGHVFDDGPPPTGLRYCMNGVSLRFGRVDRTRSTV
jgi:peptide-methionine (R)-S-oxide reductase